MLKHGSITNACLAMRCLDLWLWIPHRIFIWTRISIAMVSSPSASVMAFPVPKCKNKGCLRETRHPPCPLELLYPDPRCATDWKELYHLLDSYLVLALNMRKEVICCETSNHPHAESILKLKGTYPRWKLTGPIPAAAIFVDTATRYGLTNIKLRYHVWTSAVSPPPSC